MWARTGRPCGGKTVVPNGNDIARNRLLQRLDPADLSVLDRNLKPVGLTPGQVLHEQHLPTEQVYFPLSGMVSNLTVMNSGEAIETSVTGRDGAVGGSVALLSPIAITRATVQLAGQALALPSSIAVEACTKNLALCDAMRRHEAGLMMQACQSSACHALHGVPARLCRWLLHFHDFAEADEFSLTQDSLAHMLGVRRSSVSVAAFRLQQKGLIAYARGRIRVLNRRGLEEWACECYRAVRQFVEETLPAGPSH